VLARTRGRAGMLAGAGVAGVMLAKRIAGNRPPARPSADVYLHRLLYDSDPGAGATTA
jgi:hypothetical protein